MKFLDVYTGQEDCFNLKLLEGSLTGELETGHEGTLDVETENRSPCCIRDTGKEVSTEFQHDVGLPGGPPRS